MMETRSEFCELAEFLGRTTALGSFSLIDTPSHRQSRGGTQECDQWKPGKDLRSLLGGSS